jgi:hypothetical protein
MTGLITVKGATEDKKVVLWERNAAHPGGEVFISNDGRTHQVARTPAVARRLEGKRLVEVGGNVGMSTATPANLLDVPFSLYDEMTVAEIEKWALTLSDEHRKAYLSYERANRNRKGALEVLS